MLRFDTSCQRKGYQLGYIRSDGGTNTEGYSDGRDCEAAVAQEVLERLKKVEEANGGRFTNVEIVRIGQHFHLTYHRWGRMETLTFLSAEAATLFIQTLGGTCANENSRRP